MSHSLRSPALRPLARDIARLFAPAAAALAVPLTMAAPQGGEVTAGQASIRQSAGITTVTQVSPRAVVDWRSFSVGRQETVNFMQPNAQSAILNRVVGADPSAIFGHISANGQVYLVNPNGILFGRGAQVDVGALAASTANIANADFMAGRLHFSEPGRPGSRVEQQGRISVAEGGFAALVGRQVANSGVIEARLGKVALAAGDAFVLDLYGDRLVYLVVDPAAMHTLADAGGTSLAAQVDHSGQILAEGGRVQLSAAGVKQLVDNLVNVSGVVRATSFASTPGHISLLGDADTKVTVSGTLDASGAPGGRVEVTGGEVALQAGALLSAAGGAGSVAVGGDWQGQGALAHAKQVDIAAGARIDAGAAAGDGGTVVVWSDERTQFSGRIDASTQQGRGGQVEVSSKGRLGFQGEVSVASAAGPQGSLLLDPANLRIGGTSSGDSEISAGQLRLLLASGANVALAADQNITVDAEVNALGAGGVRGGGLSLTAGNNLTVNKSIALHDGALSLIAAQGTLGSAAGTLLYTGSGAATLRGGAGVDIQQLASGGAVDIRSANGAVAVRNALVAASPGGSAAPLASLNVEAAGAVQLAGALVQGNATLRSHAGALAGTGTVQSRAGNLVLDGHAGVAAAALLAGGSVAISAAAGGVTVSSPIAAVAGTVDATTAARPSAIGVTSRDAIDLAGGAAGSGGVSLASSAGGVTLRGSSLFSGGAVSINASGAVTLLDGAGIATSGNGSAGAVAITSSAGAVTVGSAGIRAAGSGANLAVAGSAGVNVNGDLQTPSGTIDLGSSQGAVRVLASASGSDAAQNATLDAGSSPTLSKIAITANGRIEAGEMLAYSDIQLSSATGDVVLLRGLGGGPARTGYGNFAQGYQEALRPQVGRLVISAPAGSVELNGLNLDGNRLATDTTDGVSVTAGRRIVSNQAIAVNKGDIRLAAGTTQATDGVYLGHNVYSRGWDSVGANGQRGGGDDAKTAYSIRISGKVLGLFDNTDEYATVSNGTTLVNVQGRSTPVRTDVAGYLVDVNGQRITPLQVVSADLDGTGFGDEPVVIYAVDASGNLVSGPNAGASAWPVHGQFESRDIAKIIVSNNTANYQDAGSAALRERLVPASGDSSRNLIDLSVDTIAGVSNPLPAAGRFSIDTFSPTLTSLSQAPASVAPRAGIVTSTAGIGLKLLGFEAAGDAEPLMWSTSVAVIDGSLKYFQRFEDEAGIYNLHVASNVTPVNGRFTLTTPPEAYRTYQVLVNGVPQTVMQATGLSFGDPTNLTDGSVQYTFQLEQGPLKGRARLVSVTPSADMVMPPDTVPTDPGYVAGSVTPWRAGNAENAEQSLVSLRMYGPVTLLPGSGVAYDVSVKGALYPTSAAAQPAQAVQSGAAITPSLTRVSSAPFTQAAGSFSFVPPTGTIPADFELRRATVNTSASGSFTPETAGTRLFVFDGLIETVDARSISDTIGGVSVPGFGTVRGANNSSAGFAGIGASFGTQLAGTATGTIAGVAMPGAAGGNLLPDGLDRTVQDMAPQADALQGPSLAGDVSFGTHAAAQADLGRGGAVPGSAVNVFKRRYRLGTSTAAVCAPDVLQVEAAAGRACPGGK